MTKKKKIIIITIILLVAAVSSIIIYKEKRVKPKCGPEGGWVIHQEANIVQSCSSVLPE